MAAGLDERKAINLLLILRYPYLARFTIVRFPNSHKRVGEPD